MRETPPHIKRASHTRELNEYELQLQAQLRQNPGKWYLYDPKRGRSSAESTRVMAASGRHPIARNMQLKAARRSGKVWLCNPGGTAPTKEN